MNENFWENDPLDSPKPTAPKKNFWEQDPVEAPAAPVAQAQPQQPVAEATPSVTQGMLGPMGSSYPTYQMPKADDAPTKAVWSPNADNTFHATLEDGEKVVLTMDGKQKLVGTWNKSTGRFITGIDDKTKPITSIEGNPAAMSLSGPYLNPNVPLTRQKVSYPKIELDPSQVMAYARGEGALKTFRNTAIRGLPSALTGFAAFNAGGAASAEFAAPLAAATAEIPPLAAAIEGGAYLIGGAGSAMAASAATDAAVNAVVPFDDQDEVNQLTSPNAATAAHIADTVITLRPSAGVYKGLLTGDAAAYGQAIKGGAINTGIGTGQELVEKAIHGQDITLADTIAGMPGKFAEGAFLMQKPTALGKALEAPGERIRANFQSKREAARKADVDTVIDPLRQAAGQEAPTQPVAANEGELPTITIEEARQKYPNGYDGKVVWPDGRITGWLGTSEVKVNFGGETVETKKQPVEPTASTEVPLSEQIAADPVVEPVAKQTDQVEPELQTVPKRPDGLEFSQKLLSLKGQELIDAIRKHQTETKAWDDAYGSTHFADGTPKPDYLRQKNTASVDDAAATDTEAPKPVEPAKVDPVATTEGADADPVKPKKPLPEPQTESGKENYKKQMASDVIDTVRIDGKNPVISELSLEDAQMLLDRDMKKLGGFLADGSYASQELGYTTYLANVRRLKRHIDKLKSGSTATVSPVEATKVPETEVQPSTQAADDFFKTYNKNKDHDSRGPIEHTVSTPGGDVKVKIEPDINEDSYQRTYKKPGGLLGFSMDGEAIGGHKSVRGLGYEGEMTVERAKQMAEELVRENSLHQQEIDAAKKRLAKLQKSKTPEGQEQAAKLAAKIAEMEAAWEKKPDAQTPVEQPKEQQNVEPAAEEEPQEFRPERAKELHYTGDGHFIVKDDGGLFIRKGMSIDEIRKEAPHLVPEAERLMAGGEYKHRTEEDGKSVISDSHKKIVDGILKQRDEAQAKLDALIKAKKGDSNEAKKLRRKIDELDESAKSNDYFWRKNNSDSGNEMEARAAAIREARKDKTAKVVDVEAGDKEAVFNHAKNETPKKYGEPFVLLKNDNSYDILYQDRIVTFHDLFNGKSVRTVKQLTPQEVGKTYGKYEAWERQFGNPGKDSDIFHTLYMASKVKQPKKTGGKEVDTPEDLKRRIDELEQEAAEIEDSDPEEAENIRKRASELQGKLDEIENGTEPADAGEAKNTGDFTIEHKKGNKLESEPHKGPQKFLGKNDAFEVKDAEGKVIGESILLGDAKNDSYWGVDFRNREGSRTQGTYKPGDVSPEQAVRISREALKQVIERAVIKAKANKSSDGTLSLRNGDELIEILGLPRNASAADVARSFKKQFGYDLINSWFPLSAGIEGTSGMTRASAYTLDLGVKDVSSQHGEFSENRIDPMDGEHYIKQNTPFSELYSGKEPKAPQLRDQPSPEAAVETSKPKKTDDVEEDTPHSRLRENYDNIRGDIEGSAQEQATADKQINGKNGLLLKADALIEDSESLPPQEFVQKARDLADKAESLAEDHQEKADNIENAGREDPFDGRSSLIDGLTELASHLREAADEVEAGAKKSSSEVEAPKVEAPKVEAPKTKEEQLADFDKSIDAHHNNTDSRKDTKAVAEMGKAIDKMMSDGVDPKEIRTRLEDIKESFNEDDFNDLYRKTLSDVEGVHFGFKDKLDAIEQNMGERGYFDSQDWRKEYAKILRNYKEVIREMLDAGLTKDEIIKLETEAGRNSDRYEGNLLKSAMNDNIFGDKPKLRPLTGAELDVMNNLRSIFKRFQADFKNDGSSLWEVRKVRDAIKQMINSGISKSHIMDVPEIKNDTTGFMDAIIKEGAFGNKQYDLDPKTGLYPQYGIDSKAIEWLKGKFDSRDPLTAKDLLQFIVDNKGFMSPIAERLLQSSDTFGLGARTLRQRGGGVSERSNYKLDPNTVNMVLKRRIDRMAETQSNHSYEETMMEEVLHALTVSKITPDLFNKQSRGETLASMRQYLLTGKNADFRTIAEAYIAVHDAFEAGKNPDGSDITFAQAHGLRYRLRDAEEFMVGVAMDNDVQRILKDIKSPNYDKGFLGKLFDAIKRVWGFDNTMMDTLLGRASEAADRIISRDATNVERTYRRGGDPIFGEKPPIEAEQAADGELPELSVGGKVYRSIVDAPPVKFFKSVGTRLRAVADANPHSNTVQKIVDDFQLASGKEAGKRDFNTAVSNQRNIFANRLSSAMETILAKTRVMTQAERMEFGDLFTRAVENRLPNKVEGDVGKAVEEVRDVFNQMHQYANEAGVKMNKVGDYFPRMIDADAVVANRSGFIEGATKAYEQRWKRQIKEAQEKARKEGKEYTPPEETPDFKQMAEDWYTAIRLGHEGFEFESGIFDKKKATQVEDFQRSREFNKEEAEHYDAFRDKDVISVMSRYVSSVVRRAEIAKRLGADGDGWRIAKKRMYEDKVSDKHIDELETLLRSNLGLDSDKASRNKDVQAWMDGNNLVVTAAYLKGTGLLNLVEPGAIGIRSNEMLGVPRVMLQNLWQLRNVLGRKSAAETKNARDVIEKVYGKGHDLYSALALEMGLTTYDHGITSPSASFAYDEGLNSSGKLRELTDNVHRLYFIHATETAKRETSVREGARFLDKTIDWMDGNTNLQKVARILGDKAESSLAKERLLELGVPEAEHKAFAEYVKQLRDMKPSDRLISIMDSSLMARRYVDAIELFSKQSTVQATRASRTVASNNSVLGRLFFQLTTYPNEWAINHGKYLAQQARVATGGKQYSYADRINAVGAYGALGMLTAAYYGFGELRKAMNGAEDKKEDPNAMTPPWVKDWADAFMFTGISGPAEIAWKAWQRGQLPSAILGDAATRIIKAGNDPSSNAAQREAAKTGYRIGAVPAAVTALSASPNLFGVPGLNAIIAQVLANNQTEKMVGEAVAPKEDKGSSQLPRQKTPPQPHPPRR